MPGNMDETVILRPARRPVPWLLAVPVLAALALAGGAVWWRSGGVPPLPTGTEAGIVAESPQARIVQRFAGNPAVLVVDFPSLAEQGRMLNRLAAWAEKAGVPHDRLLDDAELTAAIRASGATAETYYYGHDYSAAEVVRFFGLSARDHVALDADEAALQGIVWQAAQEPAGFGALISLPRAGAGLDLADRAVILHHELSHGEYFTVPAYAAGVRSVWTNVFTPREQAAWRTYLSGEGYDPALEDLMINEMQAYLLHTTDPRYLDLAKLDIPAPRVAVIRKALYAAMPPSWLKAATPAP